MSKRIMGKKLYSLPEAYRIIVDAFRMTPYLRRSRANSIISERFSSRLMLAVTEVNGCAMCSYAHTQMALENGMSLPEIKTLLSGELANVPEEELTAILFAQHYADNRGKPSIETWTNIVNFYGEEKSEAILGYIRMIMVGNTYGIPFGSLLGRIRGKKEAQDPRSSLSYELIMMLSAIVFFPAGILHAAFLILTKKPIIA